MNYFNELVRVFKKPKNILLLITFSVAFILVFGTPSAVIPNPFYSRMIPATLLDLFFLLVISFLAALYAVLFLDSRSIKSKNNKKTAYGAGFGSIIGFLAIICTTCSVLLVALFGSSFLLAYFEPVQPLLGLIAIIILCVAIFFKLKNECKECNQ